MKKRDRSRPVVAIKMPLGYIDPARYSIVGFILFSWPGSDFQGGIRVKKPENGEMD